MNVSSINLLTITIALTWISVINCGKDTPTNPDPPPEIPVPSLVTLTPASVNFNSLNESTQLTAKVIDQNGNVMHGFQVTWSSSDEEVASVSVEGLVTAKGSGMAMITARSGSASKSVVVTVSQTVASVEIEPEEATLMSLGDTIQLTATVSDGNGQPVADAEVTWSSSDEEIARVSVEGLVMAVDYGMALIMARSGAESSYIEVTVRQSAEEFFLTCPTPAEVSEINMDLEIAFIDDPTGSYPLACTQSNGSMDLTILQMGAYQSLRLMKRAEFTEPLPWTDSLYDWFIGTVRRIDYDGMSRSSYAVGNRIVIGSAVEVSPEGEINLAPAWIFDYINNYKMDLPSSAVSAVQLLVHEARHTEGIRHTCGSGDQTFQEMGAYAYAWLTVEWFSELYHPFGFFSDDHRRNMGNTQQAICRRFCDNSCPTSWQDLDF